MNRTTAALARLGITAVAAATIGAGLVAFAPATPAATSPATAVTLTPVTDTTAVGTCNQFVAAVTPSDGTATIAVQLTQAVSSVTTIGFCNPTQPASAANAPNSGPVGSGTAAVTTTLADNGNGDYSVTKGTITFGVFATRATLADSPMTVTVTGATGVSDSSANTWVAGGAAQAAKILCTPSTATLQGGTTRSFTCTVSTAQDVALTGVPVAFYVKSGPNATSPTQYRLCTNTDNSGVSSCGYTGGATAAEGTDADYVWVDQNGDRFPQATEPNTTVTTTWVRTAPSTAVLSVLCDHNVTGLVNGGGGAYNQSSTCQDATHDTSGVFTARVIDTTNAQPVPGVTVTWAITSTTSGDSGDVEAISPATCITGSAGTCTSTLSDTHPKDGEQVVVTASINRVGGTKSTATGTKLWHDPLYYEARTITVTPKGTTRDASSSQPMTALVTDRFGNPVPGAMVVWSEAGPGRFANGTSTDWEQTDANGRAMVTATTAAGDTGAQTVTAALYDVARNTGNYTAGHVECQAPAGATYVVPSSSSNPGMALGSPAGNCADSASLTWTATPVHPAITSVHQPIRLAGSTVTLSGRGPVGGVVSIFMRNPTTAGTFLLVATVQVGGDGSWSYQFQPSHTGTYYVSSGSGSATEKSSEVTVRVTVKVTIDRLVFWGKDARGLCVTRFLGGVFPYVPGAPVWVRNSAVVPTQPIGFSHVFQQGGSGRYDAWFALRCDRTYQLFALISGVGSDGARYADNGVSADTPYRSG